MSSVGDPFPGVFFPAAQPYNSLQRCPVCEGRGSVPWNPQDPYGTLGISAGPWRCPTCRGARVLDTFGNPAMGHLPPAEDP